MIACKFLFFRTLKFSCAFLGLFCYSLIAYSQPNIHKVSPHAKMGEVIIRGKLGNVNSPDVYVNIYMGAEKWDQVSVKNGTFEYRKTTWLPAFGAISISFPPNGTGKKRPFKLASVLFDKGIMEVQCDPDSMSTSALRISGSGSEPFNRYQAYWRKEGEIYSRQRAFNTAFNANLTPEQLQNSAVMQQYEKQNEAFSTQLDSLILAELKKYPNSYHVRHAYSAYRSTRTQDADSVVLRNIIMHLPEPDRSSKLKALEGGKAPVVVPLSIGKVAPGFSLKTPSGKNINLSDFKGRYVLLDFWASWCGPCRKINPDLVKLYEKYKGPKFEILGVSLDRDKAKWEEAIKADKLLWPQVSSLKQGAEQCEVALSYQVRTIPQNFLLDPQGKIVAMNLKLKMLEDLLKEVLR